MATKVHMKGLETLHGNAQDVMDAINKIQPFGASTTEIEELIQDIEYRLNEMQTGLRMVKEYNRYRIEHDE